MSIEAMKQALEALEWNLPVIEDYGDKEQLNRQHKAITSLYDALRQALEQPADEPVACHHKRYTVDVNEQTGICHDCGAEGRMQFVVNDTRPQPAAWVGLTDEEMKQVCYEAFSYDPYVVARAIEAKLKEKNT